VSGGPLFFNHADWLGTERVRTNSSGVVVQSFTDTPYGMNLAYNPSSDLSPMHFTGKQRDSETGLDNFGARYYGGGNSLGRFMTPDWAATPEGVPYASFLDPQTLNQYAYVRNNPMSKEDPDGHGEDAAVNVQPCPVGLSTACNPQEAQHRQDKIDNQAKKEQEQKAEVGYGETSGLVPERAANAPKKKKNPYDPSTWDPASAKELQDARENIMDISERNKTVHKATPGDSPIEQQVWNANMDAAENSNGSMSGDYFFIRQAGRGRQRPPRSAGFGQGKPIRSYGPFRNVGGGDVPRGNRTYIDIYDR
jgi:RHS repeat-associated protein